jgi:hypothetical protein
VHGSNEQVSASIAIMAIHEEPAMSDEIPVRAPNALRKPPPGDLGVRWAGEGRTATGHRPNMTDVSTCPLCGADAGVSLEDRADTLMVQCFVCQTYTIDCQLAGHFREARRTEHARTRRAMERLSVAAAATWQRGGRLNLRSDNWLGLDLQQQVLGEIKLGGVETSR